MSDNKKTMFGLSPFGGLDEDADKAESEAAPEPPAAAEAPSAADALPEVDLDDWDLSGDELERASGAKAAVPDAGGAGGAPATGGQAAYSGTMLLSGVQMQQLRDSIESGASAPAPSSRGPATTAPGTGAPAAPAPIPAPAPAPSPVPTPAPAQAADPMSEARTEAMPTLTSPPAEDPVAADAPIAGGTMQWTSSEHEELQEAIRRQAMGGEAQSAATSAAAPAAAPAASPGATTQPQGAPASGGASGTSSTWTASQVELAGLADSVAAATQAQRPASGGHAQPAAGRAAAAKEPEVTVARARPSGKPAAPRMDSAPAEGGGKLMLVLALLILCVIAAVALVFLIL